MKMPGSAFLKRTTLNRTLFFLLGDGVLIALSLYLAFMLRFDGVMTGRALQQFYWSLPVFILVKYAVFYSCRMYKMSWSYVGFYELIDILKGVTISFLVLMGLIFMFWTHRLFQGYPRSIPFMDSVLTLLLIVMFRSSKRVYCQTRSGMHRGGRKRTLIVGAGNAGEQIVRDMRRQKDCPYLPVGFIDDDPAKAGVFIQGIKVCGGRSGIDSVVKRLDIDLVLIAIPSASSVQIREILGFVRRSGVGEVKIIPGLNELVYGNVSLSDIKEIRIEDILGREQATIDVEMVTDFLRGKSVLVTGAGGSIGSELVRQLLVFRPGKIIALDTDETELHRIELELCGREGGTSVLPVVADIRDREKIETVFQDNIPDFVFHAAAYKHVPMMERYPEEAVKVNIFGTKIVAETAIACGVKKFVMVSTDKAVHPTNVMGASKRVAEKIVKTLNAQGRTLFSSVRFGNVVGSRGSAIPIFEEQIRNGGPVTVTHKEMQRYFMSIPEACILILQAAAMGEGGEVFLLDMGDPIKIVDMAREMIRLNGLEPDVDIRIVYTGVRPGEKLYEELLTDEEGSVRTLHPKIFVVREDFHDSEHFHSKVLLFQDLIAQQRWAEIRNLLQDLVPSYDQSYRDALPDLLSETKTRKESRASIGTVREQ
ncbi:MAG: polysaccharide biosynthesis protein [Deltaproteobacteria bacterium]|nr:polysaccharide biosynthesis protein [Deltaproteobacteria bacterium]